MSKRRSREDDDDRVDRIAMQQLQNHLEQEDERWREDALLEEELSRGGFRTS
jgi:hypothetical protein